MAHATGNLTGLLVAESCDLARAVVEFKCDARHSDGDFTAGKQSKQPHCLLRVFRGELKSRPAQNTPLSTLYIEG